MLSTDETMHERISPPRDPADAVPAAPAAVPIGSSTWRSWDVALAVGVAFTAHFLLFRRFGLYEDDYDFVARTLVWSRGDAWAWVLSSVRGLPQGRPISFILGSVLPFLCFQLGGGIRALPAVYLLGAAFVCLNAFLVQRLLAPIYGRSFALLGALLFTLYPADTTHPLLSHSLLLQPGLTFVLLALLAYASGRRVLPYVLAAAALFTYESALLPFFAAPLLSRAWDRGVLRRWALHVPVVLAIVLAALLLRRWAGEPRMDDLQASGALIPWRMAQAMVLGPGTSLAAFVKRSAYAFERLGSMDVLPAAIVAFLVLGGAFSVGLAQEREDRRLLFRAGTTGLVMLAGGYALAFSTYHFPPTEVAGRLTSVHLGGTLGGSMLVAAALRALWTLGRRRWARFTGAAAVALFVASLFAFRILVQRGFVDAAEDQRRYWSRLLQLVPDVSPESVVMLRGAEPPVSVFILTSSWGDARVFPLLFSVPSGRGPRLLGGGEPFDVSLLEARDGRLWWSARTPGWMEVDHSAPLPRDLLVLERVDSAWQRRVGAIELQGVTVELAPPIGGRARLARGPLRPLLVPGE